MKRQTSLSSISERIKRGPIWSATPTPLDEGRRLDRRSTTRMVEHHIDLDCCGLFLGGTCGEGPWLHPDDFYEFVSIVVSEADKRMVIAAQVSDNSALRMLRNIDSAAECGADLAVVASPYVFMNETDVRLLALYQETIEKSCLPIVFYDRGHHAAISVSNEILEEIYGMENVIFVKDSSGDVNRRELALKARRERPELVLANGDEFKAVEYFQAGYDAAMFGGSILIARYAAKIYEACLGNRLEEAIEIERKMQHVLYSVYGGESISCWLTGLKECLVKLGVFQTNRSFLDYPLTVECQEAMNEVLNLEREWLFTGSNVLTPQK